MQQVAGVFDGKEMLSQVFGGADDDWDPSALDDPAAPTLSVKGLAERNKNRAKAPRPRRWSGVDSLSSVHARRDAMLASCA